MYPVSQSVINQYIAGGAESVSLTITPVNASPITISNSNLKSFKLDRYCCSGSTFDIGTAIASEIDFVLENTNGTYNNVTFEGAEVYATTQLRGGTVIPLGYFTIDNSPRKLSTISLTALDRMVMLDKYASGITYPTTIATLINTICTRCGVTLGTQVTNTYQVKAPTSSDITYRQLLQWACQLLGCNAYFDWAGQLKIETYSTSSALSLSRNVRYTSDIYENAITITGVQYVDGNNTYLDGTDDYVLDISGNELVNDPTTAVAQIFGVVGDFTYYPYNCTTKSFPFLYPMDCVTLVTNSGTTVASIITNIEYILNKNSIIKAVGTTEVEKGYATLNPLTSTEMKIIENVSQQTAQAEVTTRTAFIIDQNKTIANSLGLYVIEQITQSGTIYYYCDAPTLAASTIIYTFGSNGFAWTDDWNGGSPTWYYSFTRDGNAVMNMLSAYKVTADQLNVTGAITFTDLDTSTQNTITTASSTASSAASAASAAQGTADGIANNIYYTGTTYIDGTKIYTNSITANQIDATNLQVSAANVTGTLTASQIDATNLQVSAANITGTLVASQIDATNLHVSAANIDGTITAGALAVSGGSGESGSITGNSSGLHIDTTSTTSCSIGLGYSGDMSLAAPDGSIDLDGQSINITSNLGDVTISSTSGSVVINSASFSGTFLGDFSGNMEGTLVASDYGTVLPAVSSQAPGTVFFLLV